MEATAKRGCGFRTQGGIYAEIPPASGGAGLPLAMFLQEPPTIISDGTRDALGLTPIGVKLIQVSGVYHVMDWVGSSNYPTPADFIEEAKTMGISRRLPKTLDYSKLGPGSNLILLHEAAGLTNWKDLWAAADIPGASELLWRCPKQPHAHTPAAGDAPDEQCIGSYWSDFDGTGKPATAVRKLASGATFQVFTGRPADWKPEHKLAIFMVAPIHTLAVIEDPATLSHESALEAAQAGSLPVTLEKN